MTSVTLNNLRSLGLHEPTQQVRRFCAKWRIREFALFGSVTEESFGPDSDIDVMVVFQPEYRPGMFDLVRMEEELADVFGRPVDIVTRLGVERSQNASRAEQILHSAEVLHVDAA